MRGTLPVGNRVRGITGIIPAYAGNTVREILGRADRRDHPRICGEHLRRVTVHAMCIGIIPAYAGNTHAV